MGNKVIGNQGQIKKLEIEDIVKIGRVIPREQSNVLFLALEFMKNGQKPLFIPGKIFDYLKLRKPTFAIANNPGAKEILKKSGMDLISNNEVEDGFEWLLYLFKNKDRLQEIFLPNNNYSFSLNSMNKTGVLLKVPENVFKGI